MIDDTSKESELKERKKEKNKFAHSVNHPASGRNKLIADHLGLVSYIAKKYISWGEPFEDIVQVGYLGLINAVDLYDPNKGAKFSTYASQMIEGEIRHYLRDKSLLIKKPRWLEQLNRMVGEAISSLSQQLNRYPTVEEIANELNITENSVIEVLKAQRLSYISSLDNGDNLGSLKERIRSKKLVSFRLPVEDQVRLVDNIERSFQLPVEDKIILAQAIDNLKTLEKKVIYYIFFSDLTQMEVAKKVGISQKHVSRLLNSALKKLKKVLSKELW